LELLVTIVIEFCGIIVFAVLTILVESLAESGFSYEQLIEEKFRQLVEWIVKVERSNRPKNLEPKQLLAVRKFLEEAFLYDFNVIVEEFDFYETLSP